MASGLAQSKLNDQRVEFSKLRNQLRKIYFQIAWESKEEQAMTIVKDHMKVMDEKKKHKLSELYTKLIFSLQGNAWTDVKWMTKWGVTFVTIWDEEHLLKNIQFAMIQEMMG